MSAMKTYLDVYFVADYLSKWFITRKHYFRLEANKSEWAQKVAETLNKMSPTSLKVTKRAIDEGINKTLAECLIMEYRLCYACLQKDSDFVEGKFI